MQACKDSTSEKAEAQAQLMMSRQISTSQTRKTVHQKSTGSAADNMNDVPNAGDINSEVSDMNSTFDIMTSLFPTMTLLLCG